MSHCHDEHSHSHSHDHSHGAHDHTDDLTPALQNLLHDQIDFDGIRTLNEATPGSGRAICRKSWTARLSTSPELESDADEQILLHIPFTSQIRLHSLHLRSSDSSTAPLTLHVYTNNETLDFDSIASVRPTQTFSLSQTSEVQEIPVKRALFNTVRHLTLFVESNYGDEVSRFSFLALKGDWLKLIREPVEVMYESAARPTDHKVEGVGVAGMGASGFEGGGRGGF